VAPDDISPESHRSINADTLAWHIPISSAWTITTLSLFEKPSFFRAGFVFKVLSSAKKKFKYNKLIEVQLDSWTLSSLANIQPLNQI
jgi:hypothetical protein